LNSDPHQKPERGEIFATTRWTVVLAAGNHDDPSATAALEELCQTYWFPLYVYIRRQGSSREDAEDLTQAFLAKFLEKSNLSDLSAEKGKFRAFLLVALKNFLANERDRAGAKKRGGGAPHLSLSFGGLEGETLYQDSMTVHLSPDKLYDRAWAIILLENVIVRLRDENVRDGKAEMFEALKTFLTSEANTANNARAAERLQITEGAVRVIVHRLRRRYRELLRNEISATLADPKLVHQEMQMLLSAFSS
jgi:RNA polymerase sigma-70 factor (ECF subfamily)